MIPKVIHYCWFGGNPLPELAKKCIESWRKFLPDYEIKEWNESNFDVNSIPYTAVAYRAKKYAFVSDYARFVILYKYGGVYFDTDVEVIAPMDDILARGPYMGCETDANSGYQNVWDSSPKITVAPGLGFACEAGNPFLATMIDYYKGIKFQSSHGKNDTTTIVTHTTRNLMKYGLKVVPGIQVLEGGWHIYPSEYFGPQRIANTEQFETTSNTRTIHHYAGTWVSKYFLLKCRLTELLERMMPARCIIIIRKIYRKIVGKD